MDTCSQQDRGMGVAEAATEAIEAGHLMIKVVQFPTVQWSRVQARRGRYCARRKQQSES
jgi:hypothetical protein